MRRSKYNTENPRNAILERVYRVADRFTDCVAEFPNDPSAWGEYLDALTDAIIDATQPPTTDHRPPTTNYQLPSKPAEDSK